MQDLVFEDSENILSVMDDKDYKINTVPSNFYVPPSHSQLLKKLKQFLVSEERIALLMGSKSSGKSTILKLFEKENNSLIYLNNPNKDQLNSTFNCLLTLDETFTEENVESLLYQLDELEKDVHLIIDGTDDLPIDCLQKLITLYTLQSGSRHKLLLAGNTTLRGLVEAICERSDIEYQGDTFYIDPLCVNNTKQFIEKTLALSSADKKKIKKRNQ